MRSSVPGVGVHGFQAASRRALPDATAPTPPSSPQGHRCQPGQRRSDLDRRAQRADRRMQRLRLQPGSAQVAKELEPTRRMARFDLGLCAPESGDGRQPMPAIRPRSPPAPAKPRMRPRDTDRRPHRGPASSSRPLTARRRCQSTTFTLRRWRSPHAPHRGLRQSIPSVTGGL